MKAKEFMELADFHAKTCNGKMLTYHYSLGTYAALWKFAEPQLGQSFQGLVQRSAEVHGIMPVLSNRTGYGGVTYVDVRIVRAEDFSNE